MQGTKHIPWLTNCRGLRACTDQNSYASLESMMSTVRVVDGNRTIDTSPHVNHALAVQNTTEDPPPNDECKRCLHRHKNKECFKQHHELAVGPKGQQWHARKALGNRKRKDRDSKGHIKYATGIDSDSEDDEIVGMAASAHLNNVHLAIYLRIVKDF